MTAGCTTQIGGMTKPIQGLLSIHALCASPSGSEQPAGLNESTHKKQILCDTARYRASLHFGAVQRLQMRRPTERSFLSACISLRFRTVNRFWWRPVLPMELVYTFRSNEAKRIHRQIQATVPSRFISSKRNKARARRGGKER